MNLRQLTLCIVLAGTTACQSSGLKNDIKGKSYTGDFAGDPIVLTLAQLDDSTVTGSSEHRGVHADLGGKRMRSEKGYTYQLKEIGSGRFDGIFELELDTSINIIFGSWRSLDTGSRMAVLYTLKPVSGQ